jgi:MFS family permease
MLDSLSPDAHGMSWPRWRLVLLLMAICFLAHFNRISMSVAADLRIMAQYDLGTTAMGYVYSAFLVAYTLLMIPGGWVIDRFGPRFSLAVVCLGSAVFIALTAAVDLASTGGMALGMFFVVRALMGVASAPLHPAAARAVSLGIPRARRSAANGLITGAALLGVASTFVVFGALVDWLDWPGAFLVAAAVTAGLGWLWIAAGTSPEAERLAPPPTMPGRSAEPGSQLAAALELVGNRSLLLLTASYAAVGYFQYLFFYWMHYYFESVLKLGAEESRRYAAIPPLAMALGMPAGGWLSDRMQAAFGWRAGRAGLVIAAMLGSAALLWFGVRATETFWIVTWLSLSLGVLGMAEGPFWVTAVEVGGARGGLSAAVFNTGGNAGGFLAPVVTPLVSDALGYGWQSGISLASLVCLAGAACWFGIGDTARPAAASPEPTSAAGISTP